MTIFGERISGRGAPALEEPRPALSPEQRRVRQAELINDRNDLQAQLVPIQLEIEANIARADELRGQLDELAKRIDLSGPQGRTPSLQRYLERSNQTRTEKALKQAEKEFEWGVISEPPVELRNQLENLNKRVAEIESSPLESSDVTKRLERERDVVKEKLQVIDGDIAAAVSLVAERTERMDALLPEIESLQPSLHEQIRAAVTADQEYRAKALRRRQWILELGVKPTELKRRPRRG